MEEIHCPARLLCEVAQPLFQIRERSLQLRAVPSILAYFQLLKHSLP